MKDKVADLDRVNTWFDNQIKVNALLEMNKNTELDDDWQWIQDNLFEYKDFHKTRTVEFVCEIFKQKWINNEESLKNSDFTRVKEFSQFRHTSPIIVQIFDQIS